MARKTVAEKIAPDIEVLRKMSLPELAQYGKDHFNSAVGFASFKKALLANGIDFEALRSQKQKTQLEALLEDVEQVPQLVLYSDAKASANRFAITNAHGEPLWHGTFYHTERGVSEQSAAEMEAAKKAVWLADKTREANKLERLRLKLFVDAQWLCFANSVFRAGDKSGGKARVLGELALSKNIILTVEWVSGATNPADRYTIGVGFEKWSNHDLIELLKN